MADTAYPDKWVRKAIYDACNDILVSGETIPVFDVQALKGFIQNENFRCLDHCPRDEDQLSLAVREAPEFLIGQFGNIQKADPFSGN